MSDTQPPAGVSETDKILTRFNDALEGHKRITLDELSKLKRDMETAVQKDKESTEHVIDELRQSIKSADDWIQSEIKARESAGKVKDNESTIVVPPNDVTPPAPAPTADQTPVGTPGEGQKRKGGWRKLW